MIELIEKHGEKISVKKRQIITEFGVVERYIYYIHKGLVRMYTYNDKGEECTFDFVSEGDYVNAFQSYKFETPSLIAIQALTNCALYRFSKEAAVATVQNSGAKEALYYVDVMENTFLRKLNREVSLIRDSKYQQFRNLISSRPELFENVPLKYIASYLGVSAQTISRFRQREE